MDWIQLAQNRELGELSLTRWWIFCVTKCLKFLGELRYNQFPTRTLLLRANAFLSIHIVQPYSWALCWRHNVGNTDRSDWSFCGEILRSELKVCLNSVTTPCWVAVLIQSLISSELRAGESASSCSCRLFKEPIAKDGGAACALVAVESRWCNGCSRLASANKY